MVDDSPVVGDNNTISMFVVAHYTKPSDNSFLYGVSDFTGTYPLPVQNVHVPPSGVVKLDLDIPSNATSLDVTVGCCRHHGRYGRLLPPSWTLR